MKGSTVFRSEKNTRFPAKRQKKKKKHGLYQLHYYAAGLRCAKCDQFFPLPSR